MAEVSGNHVGYSLEEISGKYKRHRYEKIQRSSEYVRGLKIRTFENETVYDYFWEENVHMDDKYVSNPAQWYEEVAKHLIDNDFPASFIQNEVKYTIW